ncbi:MAG TPA: hypothetical protein VI423_03000 [Paenisporosarcina sp.]|nr:hypothetical protein [Paenisporosarcina sp.]
MAIRVSGSAKLRVGYTVELEMTEEDFDNLSEGQQNEIISDSINWGDIMSDAEVDDIDVDELEVVENGKK